MAVSLDSNTWYQITESRVGLTSSLQWDGSGLFMAAQKTGYNGQFWQFQPIGNGNYQIRNLLASTYLQLTTCYESDETDGSKTRPCMKDARGDVSQQWMVQNWGTGDQTFKLVNVGNGTGYNLDCHPGNPLFMNENTVETPVQPAQHWEVAILSQINNVLYSTTYLDTSSATTVTGAGGAASKAPTVTDSGVQATSTVFSQVVQTSQTTINGQAVPITITTSVPISTVLSNTYSTSSSAPGTGTGKGGNETANKAGTSHPFIAIGVGIGVGILASTILILAFLFFMHRRRKQMNQNPIALASMSELGGSSSGERIVPQEKWNEPRYEMYTPMPGESTNKVKIHNGPPIELPSMGYEFAKGPESGLHSSYMVPLMDEETQSSQTQSRSERRSTDKHGS